MSAVQIKPFSSDAHTIEAPHVYADYVESKFKDRVPKLVQDEAKGAVYYVEGFNNSISIGAICLGDVPYDERFKRKTRPFEDLPHGGWDGKARIKDQDRDGVAGEIIYPTLGMVLCQSADADFRHAMLWAYNRWLQEFMGENPGRIVGIPQLSMRSVEDGIKELHEAKKMGFKGAMLPGDPLTKEDYDDPSYDPFWRTAVELGLPLSFHSLTSMRASGANIHSAFAMRGGSLMASLSNIVRSNQDMIGMFVWGGVFDRHPDLRLVCVEADASWAPHLMLKWDQYYKSHRDIIRAKAFKKLPSEMFKENMYMTFQYDWLAMELADRMNPKRLMWANDYPHTDGTWPNSQSILETGLPKTVSQENLNLILRDNVKELYGLN